MAGKEIVPSRGLTSFSCPECGAIAHQIWWRLNGTIVNGGIAKATEVEKIGFSGGGSLQVSSLKGIYLSQCYNCKDVAVWVSDNMIYPANSTAIKPHEDMPADVKADFEEASAIVDRSARGAAALLRLAVQKLMVDLGEKGKNVNEDIASLVSKGLETEIQQALDIVRVVGNNAVHPGQIDFNDDKSIALALFSLINLVVDRRIAAKKRLEEMYSQLPEEARKAIEKRDN
jgi:uncharacterized protein DUF4145